MSVFGRTLSRYVFRQVAGATVGILLSLTSVVWIGVALRQLELMTSQGQDALRFLIMTALAIPSMLALIAPIALLIAGIHVLNRLNGDSELIVMTAGGASVWTRKTTCGSASTLPVLAPGSWPSSIRRRAGLRSGRSSTAVRSPTRRPPISSARLIGYGSTASSNHSCAPYKDGQHPVFGHSVFQHRAFVR